MQKSELFGGSLVPAVLIAGVLSGSLFRAAPPGDNEKPSDTATAPDKPATLADADRPWISDLHPVMQSIAEALGAGAAEAYDGTIARAKDLLLVAPGPARD